MKIPLLPVALRCAALLVLSALVTHGPRAGEIRGVVMLHQSGLFSVQGQPLKEQTIGIAMWPNGDKAARKPQSATHEMRVEAGRVSPSFLLIRPGDRVRFVNQDGIEHRFFAQVSGAQSDIDVRLKPEGLAREQILAFDEPGTRHLFCRLHRRSYARIDVVDAPQLHMVRAGEQFEFRDLEGGLWHLRVAAIGAETLNLVTIAMISPPPLKLWLPVKSGSQPSMGEADAEVVSIEQLYPVQPGM